jgi:hypothetical protein
MDQSGRGKGDLIADTPNPLNTVTGLLQWPHQQIEPCVSWNNRANGGLTVGFTTQDPTIISGRDYLNLGNSFPANATPQAMIDAYPAAVNGVDYLGTFTYPHPLVSGQPTPMPSAAPRSQQHLQKKEAKKAKKKKKRRPKKNRRTT